jgi:hypothetical protein
VPWVAPEHGAFLHRCRDARYSVFKGVAYSEAWHPRSFRTYRHMNKACDIYSLMYKI